MNKNTTQAINKQILANSRFDKILHAVEIGLNNPSMNANVHASLVDLLKNISKSELNT